MKGAHIDLAGVLVAYKVADAILHFVGGLVGERQRKDVPGLHALLDEIGNLIRQHTGLTRSGTGNDQLRTVAIFNGQALALVQVVNQIHLFFATLMNNE